MLKHIKGVAIVWIVTILLLVIVVGGGVLAIELVAWIADTFGMPVFSLFMVFVMTLILAVGWYREQLEKHSSE